MAADPASYLGSTQKGREHQWAFAQKQTGADKLTIGGCLAANMHGRGLKMPPFIGDVESFRLSRRAAIWSSAAASENPSSSAW